MIVRGGGTCRDYEICWISSVESEVPRRTAELELGFWMLMAPVPQPAGRSDFLYLIDHVA
jgi:hypothetical protein